MNAPERRFLKKRLLKRRFVVGLSALGLLVAACGGSATTAPPKPTTDSAATTIAGTATSTPVDESTTTTDPPKLSATLNGSGSTFVKTFIEENVAAFTEGHGSVTVNYGGGGSGKGRQDLADQIVDFAGTDGIIKGADLAKFKGGEVLYFPVVVAPITVSYNLDGVKDLKLTAKTIAEIFQLRITKWNDPAITADNAGTTLPDSPITVVHRSDSSGTTQNFTKFLDSAVGAGGGAIWKLGTDSTVAWPSATQAGNGNGGVAQLITSTPGAIGYVDLSDAVDAKLTFAEVGNKAGKFVKADVSGASAAAAGAKIADNLTFSAIWADGDTAYPITAQTWLITYAKQTDAAKGEVMKAFFSYMLTDGQKLAAGINYAPLPPELAAKALAQVDKIMIG
ncbi:MAG: phosphate ABC transporter substrate-binding protein PstS [Ilumatobacteraceae bacterium]